MGRTFLLPATGAHHSKEGTHMKNIPYRYYLPEEKLPKTWYNLRAAMR